MLPIQDHLTLICSQYITIALETNNPSHNIVTSPQISERNKKKTPSQNQFLHCLAPYL